MKKLFSILMIFTLLFNIFGGYLLYTLIKAGIQDEIHELIESGLAHNIAVEITVPADEKQAGQSDFHMIEPGEFIYKGNYYDVIREIKSGSMIKYICVHDKKEDKLAGKLIKSAKSKEDKKNRIKKSLQRFPGNMFLENCNICIIPGSGIPETGFIRLDYKSVMLEDPAPPPRYTV